MRRDAYDDRHPVRPEPVAGLLSRALLALAVAFALLGASACWDRTDAGDSASGRKPLVDTDVTLVVGTEHPVAHLDARFLSVGLDLAQVAGTTFWDPVGGGVDEGAATGGSAVVPPYDFSRPTLETMLEAFGPGYLRLGGTESDQLRYEAAAAGDPADAVLTNAQWDAAMGLARRTGYEVLFTVNAIDRRPDGSWNPEPARALISRAVAQGDPVAGWSLGNEPNYFVFNHGGPDPEQLAADTRVFAALVRELDPEALVLGPAAAYWPEHGEMVAAMEAVLAGAGDAFDIVTWHYYPQQSERCTVKVVAATAQRALADGFLDDVLVHQATVARLRDEHAPSARIWLQETGNAQCGGQPGLSDTVRAGFWWVNELGRVARAGSSLVVRWNLSGASYALLREPDLAPNPDWWLNVLWRRVMGSTVFDARVVDTAGRDVALLDAFAHRSPEGGGLGVVLVNRSERPITVQIGEAGGVGGQAWTLDASTLDAREWRLGGRVLHLDDGGGVPEMPSARIANGTLRLPPLSITFSSLAP